MIISEVEYPLRLCVEMLHYCSWSNKKTENMKASEIKEKLGIFFTEDQITEALKILCGNET